MVRCVRFLVLSILVLSACQANKLANIIDIRITSTHYEVGEIRFIKVSEVVNEVLDKKAAQVSIRACADAPAQRVIDLMSELKIRYKGHTSLGTTEVGCTNG